VPVGGGLVASDSGLTVALAECGLGLTYAFEPMGAEQLRKKRLQRVLESYAATVPGFFLYFPSRAQRSPALRLFTAAARELAAPPRPSARRRPSEFSSLRGCEDDGSGIL
jgi:DNA-binding transcriptional LysR family regulator